MLKDGHQAENKGPQIQTAAHEMRVISAVDLVVRLTIRTAGRGAGRCGVGAFCLHPFLRQRESFVSVEPIIFLKSMYFKNFQLRNMKRMTDFKKRANKHFIRANWSIDWRQWLIKSWRRLLIRSSGEWMVGNVVLQTKSCLSQVHMRGCISRWILWGSD